MSVLAYPVLDTLQVPLQGVNLVEANAGTGKTFSIVTLYLRLILEKELTVDQILVVSFTEAATAELRDRVQERLRSMQRAFATGKGQKQETELLHMYPNHDIASRRIKRALQSFDQAAIYTIHGFCQRLLGDAAFEAGLAFATELIEDDSEIRRQIVEDFWHAETASADTIWLECLVNGECRPGILLEKLGRYMGRPLLNRISVPDPDIKLAQEEFFRLARELQTEWKSIGKEVADLLLNNPNLDGRSFGVAVLEKEIVALNQWFLSEKPFMGSLTKLKKFGVNAITAGAKKGCTPPEHPFFERFEELRSLETAIKSIIKRKSAALRERLLAFAYDELPRRKRALRQRHFDDLLRDVYEALQSTQAPALRTAVKQKFSAALIDEFQDTEPLQFAIFDALFCRNNTTVFFVGDPKQAIYGFRGADIFAYLAARGQTDAGYRLENNYRSTPVFVDSVNQLFSRPANPFVIKEIAYHESKAAVDSRGLLLDDVVQPAMNWWQIHEADIAGLQGEKIQVRIAQSVATEIARMLQLISQGRLKDDEGVLLQAKDIAVLVNTHNQGKLMRDALEQRGISCMQRTNESVFATDEAVDLKRILQAVVEPARSGRVRAALATVTLGYDAQQIAALDHNDPLWQNVLNKFADYAVFWREHGFAYMWRRLIQDFDVENRLLRLKRGQRRLSNFRHLADLIQGESLRRHGRFEEILVWLTQQQNRKGQQDGNLLRLESDENLVTIMTIHVSKGLQFPVVFCPFLFTAVPPKTSPVAKFNDKQNGPTLDLGTDNLDASSREELRERIAEQVRLDYVALTRAKLACYSVWGVSESEEKNKDAGLNWLLHYGESSEDAVTMLSPTRDCDVSERLQALASPGVNIVPLPAVKQEIVNPGDENNLKLAPRVLHNRVAAGWRLSSFSSLSALSEMEPRDYDAGKSRDVADPIEPAGIFAFPRGARAGQCIHSLFENIDFSDDAGKIQPVAERALAQSGYDLSFASVLAEMAFNVLHCNLGNARELYLRDIASQARVNEMEFYFPVEPMRASGLRAALGEFGSGTAIEKRLDALNFRMREGFMHGFIDLVFEADGKYFLADYKSNWLGGDSSFYHADALGDEIARHDYYLQYLIYSVALHRHLSLCLPDYDYQKHFGGAYYLFVRGMSPDSTNKNGIYFDRPVPGLISRLDNLFAGRPATS